MPDYCRGCFTNQDDGGCIIQSAIRRNLYKERCPCSDCLVKMTCDDSSFNNSSICEEVKNIASSIRFNGWD